MVRLAAEPLKSAKLPSILSYPEILKLTDVDLTNKLVYVIKWYKEALAINILLTGDDINIRFGDWNGKILDPTVDRTVKEFIDAYLNNIVTLLKTIKLNNSILYIGRTDDKLCLVDVRLSLNKFVGPGMIKDLFSNCIETQTVTKVVNYDDKVVKAIKGNKGAYKGELILKPSVFNTVTKQTPSGKVIYPVYGLVRRVTPKPVAKSYVPKYRIGK